MSAIIAPLALSVSLVLVAAMLCFAGLAAWRGWLELKRLELGRSAGPAADAAQSDGDADMGTVIELAAVKERLRRLEAIAAGVEL